MGAVFNRLTTKLFVDHNSLPGLSGCARQTGVLKTGVFASA
jgi:hypothetical protein